MSINTLLLNVHSDRNAGDLALSRVTIHQLETNFPDNQITLSMNDPNSYKGELPTIGSFFTWVLKGETWNLFRLAWLGPATLIPVLTWRLSGRPWFGVTPKKLQDIMRVYLNADLVVSTAGGFFRSTGKGLTFLITAYSMVLALLAGKPLYIFPQSIGPFNSWWERQLAHCLYTRARIVMVREPISIENLLACGIPKDKCLLLPDVAFGFKGATKEAAQQWLESQNIDCSNDRPLLGMTIMDWGASNPNFRRQDTYEDAMIAAIRIFVYKYRGKVLLLPQTWGPSKADDDRIVARRVAKRIPELYNSVMVIEEPLSPDLLQAVFGEMDLTIGTRMHSNIFSVTRGVPAIPIGYLHKSLGIAQIAGLDEWVIDIEQVDAKILTEKVVMIWSQRDRLRAYLKKSIPNIIKESGRAGKLVAQDFALLFETTF